MNAILRNEGTNIIKIFLIDRFAINMSYELMASEYNDFFHLELTKKDYSFYKEKYREEIDVRKSEIKELIYSSGTYSKLLDITDILYSKVKEGADSPKELSSLAATLRGYLDTLNQMGLKKETVQVNQQNNFYVLKTLAREGLIEIKNESRLKYLVDGEVYEESKPESK